MRARVYALCVCMWVVRAHVCAQGMFAGWHPASLAAYIEGGTLPAAVRYPGPDLGPMVDAVNAKATHPVQHLHPSTAVALKCDRAFEAQVCADGITSNVWADLVHVQVRECGVWCADLCVYVRAGVCAA